MRISYFSRFALRSCFAVAMLAGCGGASNGTPSSTPVSVAPPIGAQRSAAAGPASLPATSRKLYVANAAGNTVTVYAPPKTGLKRTISQGVSAPFALAFGP
jgi:hypothetical protein